MTTGWGGAVGWRRAADWGKAVGCVCTVAVTTMAAEAADLQPYQAVYELKLSSAREGSSIIGLRGVFIVEWADICEGWTVAQDMRMEISTVERQRIVNDINFSSYETSDGENLRFTMRWTARDEPFQEYSGRAVRGGSATFVVPEGQSLALPRRHPFPHNPFDPGGRRSRGRAAGILQHRLQRLRAGQPARSHRVHRRRNPRRQPISDQRRSGWISGPGGAPLLACITGLLPGDPVGGRAGVRSETTGFLKTVSPTICCSITATSR